ncbi:helix-turn-helix domain-containing protein [Cytobacillus oceanisediminis]|uniref:helix-turn-helix domain-containing protein n=1 Tax=Cytobacillus oceanisediminis TaxID=665099 RepID=UPI002040BFE0|nr:helix-turn-helix domain-containing protein [Cytobacillus oceanisediminis]MCM3405928.1 helix-turn-helix domain-containing protein [Cytobacillus oceanisediminis]
MKLEGNIVFGLYELSRYAEAAFNYEALKMERDEVVHSMYDDISPTMITFDYDEPRSYITSYDPEETALNIIGTKERYQKMLNKLERKSYVFNEGMEMLTDRERDVIRIAYQGHKNTLGLSPEYFQQVLQSAEEKLCSFLSQSKVEHLQAFEENHKQRLRQYIHAS